MTVALLFTHDSVRSFCTDRGFGISVASWIPPDMENVEKVFVEFFFTIIRT